MTRCLKVLREAACLQLAERLFQSFTPLNEKHFLPFSVPFLGNLRSVDVLRSLYDVLCEFFLNKLRKYGGASSFKLLKTIVLNSMSINSLIVFHPSFPPPARAKHICGRDRCLQWLMCMKDLPACLMHGNVELQGSAR